MTFTALPPRLAWLLIAAVVALAIAAFLIRPRPPRQVVSSLILWRRVLDRARDRSPWDRLRWLVSLLLMVAIAASMAVALANPMPRTDSSGSGRTLIVLDSSWSMRARQSSGITRWEAAIRAAHAIADEHSGGETAVATTAEGIVAGPTSDITLIHQALARLAPSGGPDVGWPHLAGASTLHFLTDGAVARATDADVVVHSVFEGAPNVAVTAFDAESPAADDAGAQVLMAVANYAPDPQLVQLTVTRAAEVILRRAVEIAAGATHREVMTVPAAGDARFHAHIRADHNALDVDDDAAAWLWMAQPLRVAVVGSASAIPAMLAQDRSVRVFAVDPNAYDKTTADVWIFDRWLPSAAPNRPALIIDPPGSAWLGPRGAEEPRPQWRTAETHPVLGGVDVALLRLGHARSVIRPALQAIAASEQQTPLVAIEDSPAGRFVVLEFATADSNFAATSAFPVLIGNAVDWLGRPERGVLRQPGPIMLPAGTRRLVAPNGQSLPLLTVDGRVTGSLPAPGLYLVESSVGQTVVTVGLADPARSNLMVSTRGPQQSAAAVPLEPGRPWWRYAAMLALSLAALEWVTWRRRVTV